jgi:hypothetical protein
VTRETQTVIHPVEDLVPGKEPDCVGFEVDGQSVGPDPKAHTRGMIGPVGYWQVTDIQETLQYVVASGARIQREPRDAGGTVTGLIPNP